MSLVANERSSSADFVLKNAKIIPFELTLKNHFLFKTLFQFSLLFENDLSILNSTHMSLVK